MLLELCQTWCCDLFHGEPVPVTGHPLGEEITQVLNYLNTGLFENLHKWGTALELSHLNLNRCLAEAVILSYLWENTF